MSTGPPASRRRRPAARIASARARTELARVCLVRASRASASTERLFKAAKPFNSSRTSSLSPRIVMVDPLTPPNRNASDHLRRYFLASRGFTFPLPPAYTSFTSAVAQADDHKASEPGPGQASGGKAGEPDDGTTTCEAARVTPPSPGAGRWASPAAPRRRGPAPPSRRSRTPLLPSPPSPHPTGRPAPGCCRSASR